jgi:hypothetical protein
MPLLDMALTIAQCASGIAKQRLPLIRRHQAEQIARLLPVIVVDTMIPVRSLALNSGEAKMETFSLRGAWRTMSARIRALSEDGRLDALL